MSEIFDIVDKLPATPAGKKEVPHKARLIFASQGYSGAFDVAFHEAETDSFLELEGDVVKLGPNGHAIESRRPYQYFEDGSPITGDQIKKVLRYSDGSEDPYSDLPKTKTLNIQEGRTLADCGLNPSDPTVSFGTVVPYSDIDKYSVEKMHECWEPSPLGFRKLVDYLESNHLALLYPYTFGRGRNLYTVLAYPVRIESKLYVLKRFCTGQIIYKHPIEAAPSAVPETTKAPVISVRIRNKAKQSSL